jgi:hypothetical protein
MACFVVDLQVETKKKAQEGLKKLKEGLRAKTATIVIDKVTGALAFRGWRASDVGLTDSCALARLKQDPEAAAIIRDAIAAAERVAGRKLDERAVLAGHHSHDGGKTWDKH